MAKNAISINEDLMLNKIYFIRQQYVMLDGDLARLYRMETSALTNLVIHIGEGFPQEFMFRLTPKELAVWNTTTPGSETDRQDPDRPVFCINREGIALLASLLKHGRGIVVYTEFIKCWVMLNHIKFNHERFIAALNKINAMTDPANNN